MEPYQYFETWSTGMLRICDIVSDQLYELDPGSLSSPECLFMLPTVFVPLSNLHGVSPCPGRLVWPSLEASSKFILHCLCRI